VFIAVSPPLQGPSIQAYETALSGWIFTSEVLSYIIYMEQTFNNKKVYLDDWEQYTVSTCVTDIGKGIITE